MNTKPLQDIFVLYVEDVPSNRKVMSLLLEKTLNIRNYAFFENSVDFMPRVRALGRIPDIVFLDIHIAPLDGFEMLQQLRTDPSCRSARIIAVTASVMNEEVDSLRASGFDGAIGKPLNLQKFPQQVASILKGETVWAIV
jgi:two-component system cell cycle response regulator DivK